MCTRAFTKIPCTRGVTTMVLLAVRDFTFGRVCVVGRNPRSSIAQKHSITLHETYCETETQAATKVEVVQKTHGRKCWNMPEDERTGLVLPTQSSLATVDKHDDKTAFNAFVFIITVHFLSLRSIHTLS